MLVEQLLNLLLTNSADELILPKQGLNFQQLLNQVNNHSLEIKFCPT